MTTTSAPARPRTKPNVQASPSARIGFWTGEQLNPRRNSLNLIRLILALAVLYHHSWPLGGFEGHPQIGGVVLGGWAVYGFFCLSGYLITASRLSHPLGEYLIHRAARILPAFWVCLGLTVAVFAPVAYLHDHGTLNGYLTGPGVTPLNHVLLNSTLQINAYGIGETLSANPYPTAWNGSLWTLYYEFICYLAVGALAISPLFRRSLVPALASFFASVLLVANIETVLPYLQNNPDVRNILTLIPFFLGGSVIQMARSRLPLHWLGAALSAICTAALLELSSEWGLQLAAPLITYVLLWIGKSVPSPSVIRRHDVSYGVYIYAFPIQQLLASFGAHRHGVIAYTALSVVLTAPFAAASWILVERPVMRRARRSSRPATRQEPTENLVDAARVPPR
ncbi:acyltransferase family protein [Cellulomonas sp. P22]|uniref:acyltransferase family protein n=1 Tax=Cellulomonas sp. P22 TaxID=3373189 RepID=UPI0037968229